MSSTQRSFVGLQNQGATNYLNCLLQTLFLTPEIRQELFYLTRDEVGLNVDGKRKKIIVEFQKLFARLQCPIDSSLPLSITSLIHNLRWNAKEVMDQYDMNEIYNLLLDGISNEMSINKHILSQYYTGSTINIIKCSVCHYESKRYEEYNQLNVILEEDDNLNEWLLSTYIDNEKELKNENAYFCTNCIKKRRAKKIVRLTKVPSIIVFNLNRFGFDFNRGEPFKINKKFEFPKSLDLTPYIKHEYKEMDNDEIMEYDLIGIVVQCENGTNAGHYHSYIRDIHNEGIWKPMKRHKVNKNKRNNRKKNNRNNRNNKNNGDRQKEEATAILVSILSEHQVLTKSSLSTHFSRMNNLTSWSCSYQETLGSFADFLRNNDEFRIIDPEKRTFSVCLANDLKANDVNFVVISDDDDEAEEEDESDYVKPKKRRRKKRKNKKDLDGFMISDDNENEMDDNTESKEMEYDSSSPHWFNFNDEDITAVFENEIDDLCQGTHQQCPYMIIYRRKCMNPGKWPPKIPPYISSLLMDEPWDIDREQITINIVKLTMATKHVVKEEDEEDMDIAIIDINNNNQLSQQNQVKMKKTEHIKSEYLEPLQMEKGNVLKTLYLKMSKWSGIDINNLQIAKILNKGRKYSRNPQIINLAEKDPNITLKQIPIHDKHRIFVWHSKFGDLALKELKRRKECIELNVYIFDGSLYPQSIYINSNETLNDLYEAIYDQLADSQKKQIENKGRFRDIDTHKIYRDTMAPIYKLGITKKCILRFEAQRRPKPSEIVIRFRLKNAQFIHAKDSKEEELYIDKNDEISKLITMVTSCFDIDCDKFELRKARSDWALSTKIDTSYRYIRELKFDETQKLIINEKVDKNIRNIDIYCETQIIDNIKSFKIPKELLLNEKKKEKEEDITSDDGMDIYENNSEILCTLNINKQSNGFDIKQAIINYSDNGKSLNLNTKLIPNLSPMYLRVSIQCKNVKKEFWKIMNEKTKINKKKGKCIVEFHDHPKKDNIYHPSNGKTLLFIYKLIIPSNGIFNQYAMYGSRYEVDVTLAQKKHLDSLKTTIIAQCDWTDTIQSKDIILAVRNLSSHKWSILKEKQKFVLNEQLNDRDIIGILDTKNMDENMINNITPEIFETKWDKKNNQSDYDKNNNSKLNRKKRRLNDEDKRANKRRKLNDDNDENKELYESTKNRLNEEIKLKNKYKKENEELRKNNNELCEKLNLWELDNIDTLNLDKLNEIKLNMMDKMKLIECAEKELIDNKYKCVACMDKTKNISFDGCTHIAYCHQCEAKVTLKLCPLCQTPYTNIRKLNF